MALVSILISTYGRPELLKQTLASAQNQSHSELEIVVYDNAGEPSAEETVHEASTRDSRIRYVRGGEKLLLCEARTAAVGGATGEFIQILDDDDLLHPLKIEVQLADLVGDEEMVATACQTMHFQHTPLDAKFVWNTINIAAPSTWNERYHVWRFVTHNHMYGTEAPLWRARQLNELLSDSPSVTILEDYARNIRPHLAHQKVGYRNIALCYHRGSGDHRPRVSTSVTTVGARLSTFEAIEQFLSDDLQREEWRQNYLWLAKQACENGEEDAFERAISDAIRLTSNSSAEDAVERLRSGQHDATTWLETGARFELREGWWACHLAANEPLEETPKIRRYARR